MFRLLATAATWRAAGKRPPADALQKAERYASEQEQIKTKAEELERERDARGRESDHLLHRHHRFANAVALFQVAIALGALAALTRSRAVWVGSLALGWWAWASLPRRFSRRTGAPV